MAARRTKFLQNNTLLLSFSCFLGLGLSLYSLYVELQQERKGNYRAMCDISKHMSCSKVFESKYGRGFGFFDKDSPLNHRNPIYGIFYYLNQLLICNFAGSYTALNLIFLILAIVTYVLTLYLAYVMFIIQSICVVCVGIHLVNLIILITSLYRMKVIYKMKTHVKQD